MSEDPPLHIRLGEILTVQDVKGSRYSFEHIPFKGIPVMTFPDDADPDPLKDMTTLQNADQMIYFRKVKATVPQLREEGTPADALIYDRSELEKNSGFINPVGTLIPQLIYVQNFGRNLLSLEGGAPGSDDDPHAFRWIARRVETESPHDGGAGAETEKAAGCMKNYGVVHEIDDTNSYISMLGRNPLLHKEEFEQKFEADFHGDGAFALLLDFNSYEMLEGKNCGVKFRFTLAEEQGGLSAAGPSEVVFTASPGTNLKVEINANGGTEGPLTFTQLGQKINLTNSDALNSRNVLFFYSVMNNLIVTGDLITDPEQSSKSLICRKSKELDISGITNPPVNRFPAEHKLGNADEIVLDARNVYITFGDRVECTWYNCCGNFGFASLRYAPVVEFSYFYRLSGEQTQNNDGLSSQEDYFLLEVGKTTYRYVVPTKFSSRLVEYDAETQTSVFRADFRFDAGDVLQKYPVEIFGLIHVTKREGRLNDILNGDGDFRRDFSVNVVGELYTDYTNGAACCDNAAGWEKFITGVQVQHGLEGTTGTLSLDKYLMMKLNVLPQQIIGALTLVAENGFYNEDGSTMNGGAHDIKPNEEYEMPWGQFFKGYAMEIQDQVSESSSTLGVRLTGIQKKLSDMKLVNCPFWDGDAVFTSDPEGVMNYFISYTGCRLKYVPEFSSRGVSVHDMILPRSWDWKAPAVNFVLGTPCLDAIREIAKKINHQFIIQPDGCGYFYHMDEYGCPEWVSRGPVVASFSAADIISMEITPYLENRYNTFLTLGVLAEENSENGSLFPAGEKPGMKFSQVHINSNDYPWSRIYTFAEPGIVTIKDLEEFHRVNVRFGTSEIYEGSVTVPGCHAFCIFDRVKIGSMDFYLTGITHDLNMQTKEWITSLSIARFDVNGG